MARADGVPVLLRPGGESARLERVEFRPGEATIFNEAWLQRLIHDHPDALPIDQIEPGFAQPIAVCMEFPTRHGPVDNLLMTPEGDIILVEAKLWRNIEARRAVVAQALDYSSCVVEMNYAEFEAAALKGDFGSRPKPASLHAAFSDPELYDEPRFIDAVSRNLRTGRIVILVVGDGIRAEVERLSSLLQSHAGLRFTFALVEMAVFRLPNEEGVIVHPRTIARTTMIERGVVHIDDQRVRVTLAHEPLVKAPAVAESITAEQFYDAMRERRPDIPEKLKSFISRLDAIGVYPEFLRSFNLKWDPPSGKPVNLGYIKRNGEMWTDAVNWKLPHELSHSYVEALAAALGMGVELKPNWHIRQKGSVPRIEDIVDRLDVWAGVIESFVGQLRERLGESAVS